MDPVDEKLDQARRDLLDLGLRNTLLNYRGLKSKGLRIIDEQPEDVFRILVDEARTMSFLPVPEDHEQARSELLDLRPDLTSVFEEVMREGDDEEVAARHKDTKLQTPHTAARLQRRLLNTHYAARTALEEQGVNILFLALGMLDWYEDDSSNLLRRAPLILIPTSLSRASVRARFTLEYTGDEIDTNLSLQVKLKSEFGVDLPSVTAEDGGLDVRDYFECVARAVRDTPRWEVDRGAIALGFFSFSKLLMYKDLDEVSWPEGRKPSGHGVLRAVLHDGFREPDPLFGEGDGLDDGIDPGELHQVRDADSSQTVALLEATAGRNLVIQGPPGTGKSQTITNLVAETIAEGKTLLFVSEKMAALEVVKRRLDEVALGDACLELHSHKTNKKAFLAELERTLGLGRPRHEGRDRTVEELKRARERLNGYCRAVHALIGESGVTPYRAYGTLLRLQERLDGIELPAVGDMGLREWSGSEYVERRNLVEELQALLGRMGVPSEHLFWGSSRTVFLPADRPIVEEKSRIALERLDGVRRAAARLADEFEVEAPADLATLAKWTSATQHALEAPDLTGTAVERREWCSERETLDRMLSAGRRVKELHGRFDPRFLPEAWEAEVLGARKELAAYVPKWWRLLSAEYRRARREISGLYRTEPPRSPATLLDAADAILEVQRRNRHLEEESDLLAELYGPRWDGWRSDWDAMEFVTVYLAGTHEKVQAGALPEELLDYLKRAEGHATLRDALDAVKGALGTYDQAIQAVVEAVELDDSARFGEGGVSSLSFDRQAELFRAWEERAARLQDMVAWNHLANRMQQQDLGPVVEVAVTWEPAARHLVYLLERTRAGLLLEQAMRERPELAGFDGETHGHFVGKFRELDRRLLELNRAYLAQKHWESLPGRTGTGQVGVLAREFQKKRRHRPIRQLMLDAGHAIQAIKPVIMMSPLSVAAYIPPGSIGFDLVVFDEASQVRPVDSFGAILRGEQAVVVGDSRQLPPTSFFDKAGLSDEEEEEWDAGTSDLESVLGLFCAQGAPDAMLRWHYRSRHESLIAVSNHEFYDGKLVVFPGPDDTRQDVGLVFRHLAETAYERGKAVNRDEAAVVAGAVMRHARERPDLTLGLASFSVSQMQAIQDELELLRSQDPSCEGFFAAHPEEPFFVKNLENVQGDERDVIFISVGYGRTREGYLAMNFGPLNQDGGERRLNVLITRARRRCEVFSNLRADDIDLGRTNARGVVAFKTFLKYAETGILDVPGPGDGEPDSPFEEAVGRALRGLGFEVRHQVGSGGFFVDLALVDPVTPGRYLLGIECDGATYHRARWARDRDRLRQEVLESLGWRIHRIWSTDWFRDPDRELRRVAESIEAAKVGRNAGDSSASSHMSTDPPVRSPGLGSEVGGDGARNADSDAVGGNGGIKRDPPGSPGSGIQVPPYRMASLAISIAGQDLHEVPTTKLADWIEEVVSVESPVHLLEVASRIANAAGIRRVGRRIRAAMDRGAKLAARKDRVRRRGDFLWSPGMETAPVRDRAELPSASRQIECVPPEELAEAVVQVVDGGVGVTPAEAVIGAGRLLGYARVTDSIKGPLERAIRTLLGEERLRLRNGFLLLP